MILGLDTTQNEKACFALWNREGGLLKSVSEKCEPRQTDKILERLVAFLLQEGYALSQGEGIIVAKGPGAFTALRVGVTIANTLAYALHIPVLGIERLEAVDAKTLETLFSRPFGQIEPDYGRPPHITSRK